jgi:hypothetical protein
VLGLIFRIRFDIYKSKHYNECNQVIIREYGRKLKIYIQYTPHEVSKMLKTSNLQIYTQEKDVQIIHLDSGLILLKTLGK